MKKAAPIIGLIVGIALACLLALFFRENPLHVLKVLLTSSYNSKFDFGLTLFYTTCLIFSGLAFSIPMKAGLFHIGAEGQIIFSAVVAAYLGHVLPFDTSFSILLLCVLTALAGFLAAYVIALLKLYRQAHEVVVAIMLNFILSAFATWFTINRLQNPNSQNPETHLIQPSFQFLNNDFLKVYFEQSAVSSFFLVAILFCIVLFILEQKTLWGLQIRAYGSNPLAARRLQISDFKILTISLGLAGVCSALVGLTEVLGNTFQFKIGFSPQYGFLGIAVALLARNNFLGIIASAFLMASLHKGASDLDLETKFLTRDFSLILQAIIIFSVASSYYFFNYRFKKKVKLD
ncbi:MAG: ABC transporter permease [Bdellovibrionaceae bacterium]|nr:ABC transporter permease [Bdellovibrio sp.]